MRNGAISAVLEAVTREVPGWSPHDQLLALYSLAVGTSHLEGDIFELGVWCGRSTVALGLAAGLVGCEIHCVDLFPTRQDWSENADGSYSMRVNLPEGVIEAYQVQTVWKEPFERDIEPVYRKYPGIREAFDHTIAEFGVASQVHAHPGTSSQLLKSPLASHRYRLAFLDGDHGYEAVCKDIERVAPRLVPGGWICFDDAFTCYEGVDNAIRDRILADPAFDCGTQITRKMFAARKRVGSAES